MHKEGDGRVGDANWDLIVRYNALVRIWRSENGWLANTSMTALLMGKSR